MHGKDANYSLENLKERAEEARKANAGYIANLEEAYLNRCEHRRLNGIPVVAYNGYSRAGKDTAAEYIGGITKGRVLYAGSSSWRGMPIMAHMVGISPEQLYAERHEHRDFMIAAFHAIRGDDYSFLVRLALGASDLVVGVRGRLELDELVRSRTVLLNAWIDNPRVPKDKTVEYGQDDCDLSIHNHGSLFDFYARVYRFAQAVYPAQVQ